MELVQLKYFVTLCRHRHFGKAAAELYVTPPALTNAIKRLEEELGKPLLDHKSAVFKLTEEGKEFLLGSEHILSEIDALKSKLLSMESEREHIKAAAEHAAYTVELEEWVREFSKQNPRYSVELSRRAGKSVLQLASQHEIDLGIVLSCELNSPEAQSVVPFPFRSEEYGLYCRCDDGEFESPVQTEKLRGRELPLMNFSGDIARVLRNYFEPFGVTVSAGSITNIYPESAVNLISQGIGRAVFPLNALRQGDAVSAHPFSPPLITDYSFIVGSHTGVSDGVRELMDFLRRCSEEA